MLSVILSTLVGGGLGTALGHFGHCSSGSCPLLSTWWRGALYGAALGLLFGLTSLRGRSPGAEPSEGPKFQGDRAVESVAGVNPAGIPAREGQRSAETGSAAPSAPAARN